MTDASTDASSEEDEFRLLSQNASEVGLPWSGRPEVRRRSVEVAAGQEVSALLWGTGSPELVLLHGGAQNAHTWDTVALALDRPLAAIDLPGHGRSSWRDDHDYRPATMAADLAPALRQFGPDARLVVGMSLGGLAAICLAADFPDLVARLALVDITPGTDGVKAEPVLAFLSGPERFGGFQEMLERTIAFNPTRSVSSLRRGVIHNAREFSDGSWGWRWDPAIGSRGRSLAEFGSLWPAVGGLRMPVLLLRGARSRVVSDDDVAELLRRLPDAAVEVVPDAGHSIQGDQPRALARRLDLFLES